MIQFYATFISLTIAGMTDAGYLLYKRLEKKPLVCPINHDCNAVTQSSYSKTLGIPNDFLGLLYYLSLFISAILLLKYPAQFPELPNLLRFVTVNGVLFSVYLTYLQAYILKDYCFYCLISAGISILLSINSFGL